MFITCYHGTSKSAARNILDNGFIPNKKAGLWIGPGTYFFQDGSGHAKDWALDVAQRKSDNPAVFRVKIELRNCIDLIDNEHWEYMRKIYARYRSIIPDEQPSLGGYLRDPKKVMARHFDDSELIVLYVKWLDQQGYTAQSIRCSIPEGEPIFKKSWLLDKACVMINVLDPKIIVGIELVSC